MSRLQAAIVTVCVVALAAVAAVLVYRHEAPEEREQDERIACGGYNDNPFTNCRGTGRMSVEDIARTVASMGWAVRRPWRSSGCWPRSRPRPAEAWPSVWRSATPMSPTPG